MNMDFTKEFFKQSWGLEGYYEHFSYGVGIDVVCEKCLYPFINIHKEVLEIGSGGGVFTGKIFRSVKSLTCIDVIPKPHGLPENINYIELDNQDYNCTGVEDESIDFCFCYNVFCHFSNDAIKTYLASVNRVLKPGGDFVFMLSAYGRGRDDLGTLLPMGHFVQDERTLPLVIGDGWEVISPNMIPEHRDIIVHLKKNMNNQYMEDMQYRDQFKVNNIKDYSQHGEQQVITDYFKGFFGTLCDIGANDGKTFSNSRALLEGGWYGVLVEPCEKTFEQLTKNCEPFVTQVLLHNVGISDYCGDAAFYESGSLIGKEDHSLVSSMKVHETDRWRRKSKPSDPIVSFTKTTIPVIDFATLLKNSSIDTFDFITIDVEGMELEILRQIDIKALNCKMICIEYNGDTELAKIYDSLIPHPVIYKNKTNIIYAENKEGVLL